MVSLLDVDDDCLPINAFGMVILSHCRSRISSPESGCDTTRRTWAMSVLTVRFMSKHGPLPPTTAPQPEPVQVSKANTVQDHQFIRHNFNH